MIRRHRIGWVRPTRHNASNHPDLPLSKGVSREVEKIQKREAETQRIAEVRRHVWARSAGRCEVCHETEADAVRQGRHGKITHECHEAYSRALTRKRPPSERFDPRWGIRVCPPCHRALTKHRLEIAFYDVTRGAEAGADAMVGVKPSEFPIGWYTAAEVWQRAVQPTSRRADF